MNAKIVLPLFYLNSTLNFLWTYLDAMLLSHSLHALPCLNKFEQVSSDHHQMPLARRGPPGLKSRGGYLTWPVPGGYPTRPVGRGGTLPYDLSQDAFDVTYPPTVDRQTYTCTPPPWTDRHTPVKHYLPEANKKGKIKAMDIVFYLVGYPLQLMSTVSTTPHASSCWCTYTASNLPADDCVLGLIQRM